jgi:hypothetical protein
LTLTLLTSSGCSVGIVRSQTQATELFNTSLRSAEALEYLTTVQPCMIKWKVYDLLIFPTLFVKTVENHTTNQVK